MSRADEVVSYQRMIQTLRANRDETIRAWHAEGASLRTIADVIHTSPETVRSIVQKLDSERAERNESYQSGKGPAAPPLAWALGGPEPISAVKSETGQELASPATDEQKETSKIWTAEARNHLEQARTTISRSRITPRSGSR